jgi:hypothetical protein
MALGITKRYELSRTRDVIYDLVSSNISDPLTGEAARSSLTHWIFKGFPNPADIGKPAPQGFKFPFIVIPYSELDDENMTVDGTKDSILHTISIECHARTRGKGDDEVDGRTEANELAEEIRNILKVTEQADLKKASLYGPDVIGSSEESDFIGGNKYYTKIITYQFKRFD